MIIAVVGGSGFIGTRLTRRLVDSGHDVRILDKKQSSTFPKRWLYADVTKKESILSGLSGCSVIYNLAAKHHDNVRPKSLYYKVNVEGARILCSAAEELGIERIIFTSSVAVYGFNNKEIDEADAPIPVNDYGKSKLEAEKVYSAWQQRRQGRSLTIVRPTVIFGEANRGNVYNLFRQLQSKYFLMVGNGRNIKSMAYVENLAAFLEYVLRFDVGVQVFNYVDKPDLDMNNLVSFFRVETGKRKQIAFRLPFIVGYTAGLFLDFLGFVIRKKFPISAIRIVKFCSMSWFGSRNLAGTSFHPPFTLSEGLRRTIRHEFPR
jgi:GlcNAc-P-P-Und epimerase